MNNALHFGLNERVVVITGAAQGIGEACARRLVHDGAAVALWDVSDAPGQALAAELQAQGGRAVYLHCDVSSKAQVDAALAATLSALGPVDGLVSNAGIFRAADFLEVSEADWDAVIAVNLKGGFLVGQAVARAMAANRDGQGFGAIVHMSSVNGAMAIPLADKHIRVNAVGPGTIATELARAAVLTSEDSRQRILGRTPMKRLGEPAEVADVVAFLLSDAASYMTGEIVYVDGGRRALNYTVAL
jgi:NAD(P)-dependent dehydrogenase (short-subunit alcohol dehydrogenase family)